MLQKTAVTLDGYEHSISPGDPFKRNIHGFPVNLRRIDYVLHLSNILMYTSTSMDKILISELLEKMGLKLLSLFFEEYI